MRCDDATNMNGREKYRNFGRIYPKKNSFERYLLRKKTNTIYGRTLDLSTWNGLA